MLGQSLRLGRILGIPFGVNFSWFVIFALITMSLTTQYRSDHPQWSLAEHILFGVSTSLLFFGSVVLHELGHSVVALRFGIPVRAITLFVFGGVAQIGREPERPVHEFAIAVAGPIVSAVLAVAFYALMVATADLFEGFSDLSAWLGRINLTLAVFNLIPGFPLDGGRILRSLVWQYTKNFERATRIASGSGQFFAYAFILWGIWEALQGNFFSGLWIGFIGWFLLTAAQGAGAQIAIRSSLQGMIAGDLMTQEFLLARPGTTVAELVHEQLLRRGNRCAMVVEGERLAGIVTLHEIKQVPLDNWHTTRLEEIMIPDERLHAVAPDTPVDRILQRMNEENVSQMPVVDGGRLVGLVGRDRLLAAVQTRLELKM